MQTTVNVVCYKSKTLSNGNHPLMIRLCQGKKLKYISLGLSVKPEHWDFEKSRPKKNCPNKEKIQQLIFEKTKEYQEQILEYKVSNRDFTATTLIEKINNPIKAKTVKEMFDLYIKRLDTSNRLMYANMFRVTLNSLLKFNGHLDVYFPEIDVAWLKRYEAWLHGENLALNTLGTRFRTLRVIYNLAIEEKIVKPEYYPFNTFKVSKLSQKTAKRSIAKDEIISVLNYQGKTSYEKLAIDLFTFSYLTAGINFTDIARLTNNNLMDGRLVYTRKKTKKLITIPLQPRAVDLITKHARKDSPYLFPILSPFHKTEQQKAHRIHKVIAKVNKALKEIGKELEIQIDLTTYVARHSYATVLKRSGVSTAIISESLGHSSERITQIYLDSFENSQIDAAMANLL